MVDTFIVRNQISILPDGDGYKTEVASRGIDYSVHSVDLEDGIRGVPIKPIESPNLEAMANIGLYDGTKGDEFILMMISIFENLELPAYIAEVERLRLLEDN